LNRRKAVAWQRCSTIDISTEAVALRVQP